MTSSSFKNDKQICDDIIKHLDELHNDKSVFYILPEITLMIQRKYKHFSPEEDKLILKYNE